MPAIQKQGKHGGIGSIVLLISLVAGLAAVSNRMPLDPTVSTRAASSGIPSESGSIGSDRGDPILEAPAQLSEHELKAFYVRCSEQSIERRLDGGEAMACSIAYEILLSKHFGGDFELLLAWSRAQATASPR